MWYTPLSNVIESGPSRWTRRCDAMEVDVDVAIVSAVTFHSTVLQPSVGRLIFPAVPLWRGRPSVFVALRWRSAADL